MEVVEGDVQVLKGAIIGKDINDLIHLMTAKSIPADIKLLQVARASYQLKQFLIVRLV